jgi:hypothetical protein
MSNISDEIKLRYFGGCSICKLAPFAAPGHPGCGWMCEHAAALTQADIAQWLGGNGSGDNQPTPSL